MNVVIENILNRRSVRVYSEEQIRHEDLDLVLKAGIFSPSGCNAQPWHFSVVQNKEIINNLNLETKKELIKSDNETFRSLGKNEKFDIFYNAPTIIVVSGEKEAPTALIDCSAATENMILAAESLGIGTCWIGFVAFLFKEQRAQELMKKLEIPEGYEPYFAITFGYKKFDNPKPQPRRANVISYIK